MNLEVFWQENNLSSCQMSFLFYCVFAYSQIKNCIMGPKGRLVPLFPCPFFWKDDSFGRYISTRSFCLQNPRDRFLLSPTNLAISLLLLSENIIYFVSADRNALRSSVSSSQKRPAFSSSPGACYHLFSFRCECKDSFYGEICEKKCPSGQT